VEVSGVDEDAEALAKDEYRVSPIYGVQEKKKPPAYTKIPKVYRYCAFPFTLCNKPLEKEP